MSSNVQFTNIIFSFFTNPLKWAYNKLGSITWTNNFFAKMICVPPATVGKVEMERKIHLCIISENWMTAKRARGLLNKITEYLNFLIRWGRSLWWILTVAWYFFVPDLSLLSTKNRCNLPYLVLLFTLNEAQELSL